MCERNSILYVYCIQNIYLYNKLFVDRNLIFDTNKMFVIILFDNINFFIYLLYYYTSLKYTLLKLSNLQFYLIVYTISKSK